MTELFGQSPPEQLLGPLNDVERRHAPEALFWRGNTELLAGTTRVAIVGSRTASQQALRKTFQLARDLVRNNVVIVSGLAKGIDTAAHRTAIENRGQTIAVIGTPLERAYPPENKDLQEAIATQFLLLSQFPSGYPTTRSNFPRRNRVMALISHASVIVEAGETSGSLSQGWEALRLNRPLFIMQSVIERYDLKWPREMLKYGAIALADTEDVLERIPAGDVATAAAF